MAKNINNTNFDSIETQREAVAEIEQHVKALKKEAQKKTHVSVLLSAEDFAYVHERCHKLGISKNEFYKMLLDNYRSSIK